MRNENKIQKNKTDRRKDFFGKESENKEKNKRVVNKENCVEKQLEKLKKIYFVWNSNDKDRV